MRRPLRLAAGAGLAIITAGAVATVIPARAAAPNVLTVGVDNASPAGHNFEYVDYFPRAAISVQNASDVVDFKWNSGAADGLHTVTFLTGPAPNFALPDTDDASPGAEVNGAAFGPSFTSPPTPCGATALAPCTYDGSKTISSGAKPTAPGGDFFVTFALSTHAPTTLTYHCLVHPAMQGTLTVVPTAGTPQAAVTLAASAQYATTTADALTKEAATNNSSVTTNSDGTHTLSMTAGTAVQYVEILEMLPNNVTVQPGDKVKWNTTTITDIHTVTFPNGSGSNGVDPFGNPVCETTPDSPAPGGPPPNLGCTSPAEIPLFPQPQGPTAISSPTTVATSGIIANGPPMFPTNYTFSFPNVGSFVYQCRIHDHMVGTVVVSAAVAPAPTPSGIPVPSSGGAIPPPGSPHSGGPVTWLLGFAGMALLLALSVVGLIRTRRTSADR